MIPRSKSAPKLLDRLAVGDEAQSHSSSPPRLSRSRTAHMPLDSFFVETGKRMNSRSSRWEAAEDPFNLTGFFPSRPTETETEWDWINAAEKPELGEESDDVLSFADEDIRTTRRGQEENYDEIARQVIDGEDKMGMLAFSSEKIPTLLQSRMPGLFERAPSPVLVESLSDDELELDPERLYSRYCLRRQNSEEKVHDQQQQQQGESAGSLGLGMLFSTKEQSSASSLDLDGLPYWFQVVTGWVGKAPIWRWENSTTVL